MLSLTEQRHSTAGVGTKRADGWPIYTPETMTIAHPLDAVDAFNELCCYTLAHRDPAFIHQHAVDAFAAQNADERTRPIALTFALVGLYLHVEKGYTGKQVQRAHQRLAGEVRTWPTISLPGDRGLMSVAEVVIAPEGAARDHAIDSWCDSVWQAYRSSHDTVAALVHEHGIS